ncbi:serine hydrolase [uncultured Psychroserpens sp.]|uniref:serine hydrolase n=1 Tax=uncultured Psychroserpens sp. TaxID=255436 RepID=UPI00260B9FD6|nr:serine hydrolase [uncultured Psychroserpens sp.]
MKIITSIFFILCSSISLAQVNSAEIDRIINNVVKTNGPGAIVYVKQKGKVLYEKAFGKSNIELNVDMKTKNTFNIASISKEFTAMSILQLMEKGKLSLEDNLNKYLPNYSKNGDKIKIKHLLSHTSGLKSHTDTIWANTDGRRYFESMENVLNYFKKDVIKFEPGERHDYCNLNFNVLAYIIEQTSGMSYSEYVEEHIFKPLDMTDSYIPNEGQVIPNLSTGYELKDNKIVYARYHSLNQTRGSSSIHTTVQDLAKWYEGLMNSKVVSRTTLRKAWSPFVLNNGMSEVYGYGFYSGEKFNKTAIFHNGFIFGYSTSDMYFPEDDLLILVASNISDINVINTNNIIFDIAANIYKKNTPKLTAGTLDSYVGNYRMKEGFGAKVFREGLQLFIIVSDGKPDKLFPESQTVFMVKDFPAKAEFLPSENDSGEMGIILSRGADRFEGIKED